MLEVVTIGGEEVVFEAEMFDENGDRRGLVVLIMGEGRDVDFFFSGFVFLLEVFCSSRSLKVFARSLKQE